MNRALGGALFPRMSARPVAVCSACSMKRLGAGNKTLPERSPRLTPIRARLCHLSSSTKEASMFSSLRGLCPSPVQPDVRAFKLSTNRKARKALLRDSYRRLDVFFFSLLQPKTMFFVSRRTQHLAARGIDSRAGRGEVIPPAHPRGG